MPTPHNLDDIFHLLQGSSQEVGANHFLFLLGTDTVFTPKPTVYLDDPVLKKTYERGETLSYAALAVASHLKESFEVDDTGSSLSFKSASVDVLNGPTTLGTEVGQRISDAIFLALHATARGKTTLVITAHSRGAVEAILVIHELERIKLALHEHPDLSLFQILLDSPCSYTKAAISAILKEARHDTAELRHQLFERLSHLKIHPFLIDPVPGGRYFGLPYIRWSDERFYQTLPCHQHELLLCRDERTRCFIPVVPNGLQVNVIPGHHGSASGNRYTQQYLEVPEHFEARDTTTVQDLVLCKLFHFYHQRTNLFPDVETPLELKHSELDETLNKFLKADEATRLQIMVDLYQRIHANDEAYKWLSENAYPYLGLESNNGHRYVHYRGHNYHSLAEISPLMHGGFINIEHATLFLRDYIEFKDIENVKPDAVVYAITWALKNTMLAMVDPEGLDEQSKLLELMSKEAGRKIFFDGLGVLVETISQKYLRNHLSKEDKQRLLTAIRFPFTTLSDETTLTKLSRDNLEILTKCKEILQDGLKNTVENHYQIIIQQSQQLQERIEFYLTPSEKIIDEFMQGLDEDQTIQIITIRKELLSQASELTIETIQQTVSANIKRIRDDKDLEITQKELIIEKLITHSSHLNLYVKVQEESLEQWLQNIEQLYSTCTGLYEAYPDLNQLLDSTPLNIQPFQLDYHSLKLERLAGLLLKEKKHDLRIPITCIDETFFQRAKIQAIALGAPSPSMLELQEQLASQQTQIKRLQKESLRHNGILRETERKNQRLERSLQDAHKINQGLTLELKHAEESAKRLRSKHETTFSHLIEQKLLPLTNAYLRHLQHQIKRFDSSIEEGMISPSIPTPSHLNEFQMERYNALIIKYNIIYTLKKQLTYQEKLPSERVHEFASMLSQHEMTVSSHRDSAWKRFSKACFVAVLITATGIIPGLIALLVYAKTTGHSPLFFTQSHGRQFIDECKIRMDNEEQNAKVSPIYAL